MLFQSLDEKEKCAAIYLDGQLSREDLPKNLSKTWSYSSFLDNHDVLYASLFCPGQSIESVCPDELKDQWTTVNHKLKAIYRALSAAKISLNDNCFYDLVPERFLLEYCDIKNKITEHVLETREKPKNYDFLLDLTKLVTKIKYQPLKIDTSSLKHRMAEYKVRQFYKKVNSIDPYVKYDIYGTKTGRLTTKKNSFPVLTLDKTYRSIMKPSNDWFLELDYNAAELRTLLALSGGKQPLEDLHAWNQKILGGELGREEVKKSIFGWLYNPYAKNREFEKLYNREMIKKKYWDGTHVNTYYNRSIESDEYHALNYIIQSTFSDLILRQAVKVDKILKGRKTNIAFMIHDSIILDIAEEDSDLLNEVYHGFADTEMGTFKTSAKAGKNFGDLKELWIKY